MVVLIWVRKTKKDHHSKNLILNLNVLHDTCITFIVLIAITPQIHNKMFTNPNKIHKYKM